MKIEKTYDIELMPLSLSKVVANYIDDKILSGVYKSGDRVNEYVISEELGISRAPIREAIREHCMLGVLDFLPRRGSSVATLDADDVNEIFDIRISLEKDIIKIIKEQSLFDENSISVLRSKAGKLFDTASENTNETNTIYTLNKLDIDFHTYIWSMAGSPRRAKMLRSMFMQLLIAMNKNTSTLGKVEEKAKEHLELVDILQNGSVREAQDALEIHINHYRNELYNIVF